MKYLDFTKSHVVTDLNGGWIVQENGEALSIPFEAFFKGLVLVDDRWGKSVKLLTSLMDIREQVKELSFNDNKKNKILELSDEQWSLICEILENPQVGFNVAYASSLLAHVKDVKEASSIKPNFDE